MKKYEGRVAISLTTSGLANQIKEARDKLDKWLKTLRPPGKNKVQSIRLVSSNPLVYEVTIRERVENEYKTIL